ncbi:MAG: slipin family protein [Candidatus Melainabacteria bacterium]|nr:slipin family protein [Candidatus Melainabacteria bacterium]
MNPLFSGLFVLMPATVFVLFVLISWIRIINEYERGVVFRLGRLIRKPLGPGIQLLIAPGLIDRLVKVDLRTVTLDVPPQDVITRDNVSIKVNAVVYYRVVDPIKAVMEIENYSYATSQMAQTTLRSIVGEAELDGLLASREEISHRVQEILDIQTDPWGIKVSNVEIKHVDLPADMQRAMARQAEAERERRAKIISAEGEFQAAEKLTLAAQTMATQPMSLQMRYLQTMTEMSAESQSTTIVMPIPLEFLEAFQSLAKKQPAGNG